MITSGKDVCLWSEAPVGVQYLDYAYYCHATLPINLFKATQPLHLSSICKWEEMLVPQ